jgi:PAS domain S-box-containing protein
VTTAPAAQRRQGRILVVDDSRFVRGFVAEILAAAGYDVDEAEDGAQALKRLDAATFDVVVTDLNMPMLDGFAVLETVKLRDLGAEVVILTGSHARDIDAAIRALRLGAHDFLTKPLAAPEHALLTIDRAIEKKRQREALREAERRYHTLFDRLPVGLYRTTAEGRILEANLALVQMLGYPDRETLLAQDARALYADTADRERWREALTREGVLSHFDVLLRRHDGTTLWVEENTRAALDPATQVTLYEGCVIDISRRKPVPPHA